MIHAQSLTKWKTRHAILVWIGILLNFAFVVPLVFWPHWILDLFDVPAQQLIWPRFSGLLLGILSIFYIPATFDIDRYRIFAWLAVFPSRTFGSVFFFLAVFAFGQPVGFLAGVLLDGSIGIASLICLLHIVSLEQDIASGRGI
ncbi:hypothetical protein [Sinorhizobium fredii]|uniref:Transmembrane protein n=2 Tax=Rhizobium fredii TaxID=380 RepID=A0A844A5M0_RHIFR|nr:hypothetical protein [Sinorhizobium fredii]AWI62394.1 hypothetical protein AB395_00006771 [Sinorhizobium fredii CCBAU 45436]KSV80183.1 membrane protein [Sinorhizobium fredii USDA 205]MQX06830.1 hypothetical protein [Sinorhizobium fredii]CCE97815.1 hypothetical protein SFHH103_03323 [Sinorhizobium fredii HH103]